MSNVEFEPRDIIKLNDMDFYVLSEYKTEKCHYVMLASVFTGETMFGAKVEDKVVPVTDEELIFALAQKMLPEATENANKLKEMAMNALRNMTEEN